MKLKFDACSLIECEKLQLIPIIKTIYNEILITDAIYDEVIEKGKKNNFRIANSLEQQISEKIISRINAHQILKINLGSGESETIGEVLYENQSNEEVAFVTEDKKALQAAIKLNLDVRSIEFLLLEACIHHKITENEFNQKILEFNKFHKLSLFRITELKNFLKLALMGDRNNDLN